MKRSARFLAVWLLIVVPLASVAALGPAQAADPAQATVVAAPTSTPQILEGLEEIKTNGTPAAVETPEAEESPVANEEEPAATEEPAAALVQQTGATTTTMVIEDLTAPVPPPPDPSYVNGLQGMVINWAYRNEAGFPVRLTGGGWQLEENTDSNAMFSYTGLGEGIGILNPVLAEGADAHPLTVDLAIPVAGPADRMVNLGLYGGDQVPTGLPMSIGIQSSSAQVTPGEKVQFVVNVKNNMPHTVHQVMVTDLYPDGLVPQGIATSAGSAWLGGQFAAAAIGELQQGQTAVVTMTAQLAPDISQDHALTNRASLIYNESVALQDSITINNPEIPTQLPETGVGIGLQLGALLLLLAIIGFRQIRLHSHG